MNQTKSQNRAQELAYYTALAVENLMGKVIQGYSFLSPQELKNLEWNQKSQPLCFQFTDGTIIFPSKDKHGSEAGHFGVRSSMDEIDLTNGIITEVGYLSPEHKSILKFKKTALYFKVQSFCGNDVLIVAQANVKGTEAGAVYGTSADNQSLLFPELN